MPIDRVMGLETEYGISRRDAATRRIHDTQHQDENTRFLIGSYRSGAPRRGYGAKTARLHEFDDIASDMLPNGSRFYQDHGHPELSTPECRTPLQLVIYDMAGARIVDCARAAANAQLQRTRPGHELVIHKNNDDGAGHSFGCHENYLMERRTPWERIRDLLMPFLVTRQIFTGAGKVGISEPEEFSRSSRSFRKYMAYVHEDLNCLGAYLESAGLEREYLELRQQIEDLVREYQRRTQQKAPAPDVYQLSQRADSFMCKEGEQTTEHRPLINTRDEPHADPDKYRRLHVIVGDANLAPWSTVLKVGTTSLVLDLIEDGLMGYDVVLRDPVALFKSISRDQDRKWDVTFPSGSRGSAIDHQEIYLNKAAQHYSGDPVKADIIKKWGYVLDALRRQDTDALGDKLDHAIKKRMLDAQMQAHGWALTSPEVRKLDLRYHDIDQNQGVFARLQQRGYIDMLGISDRAIDEAMQNPPADTRAYFRAECIRKFGDDVVAANWNMLIFRTPQGIYDVPLQEPLRGTKELTGDILEASATAEALLGRL